MLIVTTNDLPGYKITKVIGEVNGLTRQLQEAREEALTRLKEAAEAVGANAVLAVRYDSNELQGTFQEILAYGTAVVAEEL